MTILNKIERDAACGCDRPEHIKSLISLDDALLRISTIAACVFDTDTVTLHQAAGRVLSTPVYALAQTPPFDNSAMDGYAVNTDSFQGEGPWDLNVTGRVPAGQSSGTKVSRGTAARIFTGAAIPEGADAVIMQEDVNRAGNTITISKRPGKSAHIRHAGEDMQCGDLILNAGQLLGTREIAACAAAGCGQVEVFRKLRVGLLVTGDEVKQAGSKRGDAEIWDINTPMLQTALSLPFVDIVQVSHGLDSRFDLKAQLKALSEQTDLLITTGGISVGEEDHVKPAMKSLGAELVFSGVALKPGKPVTLGRIGNGYWLGLPGNPLSAFVTWQVLGSALLKHLSGQTPSEAHRRIAVTAQPLQRKAGRTELRPAVIVGFDGQGREIIEFENGTHSGRVAGLPLADGLMILPAEVEHLPGGAMVEFQTFCEN